MAKIHISEAEQVRLMLQMLTILDGTNERLPDVVRTALRELKSMFALSDESENEANRQHHERWKGLSQGARGEGRLATVFSQLGSEPTKPAAADDSQAQPVTRPRRRCQPTVIIGWRFALVAVIPWG